MLKNLKNKKKKGFTLIELIIVIAIIAILAAVAIPKFVDVREKAAINTDITNAKTIANAAATLYAEGNLKNEENGTQVVEATEGTTEANKTNGNKVADYLQDIPVTKASYGSGSSALAKGQNFIVVVNNGDVSVYAGVKADANKLYPAPPSVD